ncbi:MAG: type VI secretion system baseplate subunit TssF, partial [Acidobacteria bacterium]|nr:type VI secretion system baseplate subunit TssF [Acidobacteriota bacterium]
MRDELLGAYERELTYLRRLGAEFAGRYPKIAARLALEQDKCDDPHVERLIESVAFLCARVRLKIDDDFPEITDALLSVLYPSFLSPVPSTSIVQFVLDPNQASLQVGKTLPRGSMLASRPVDGAPCRFQTAYPVTLWPIELTAARFELPGAAGVSGNDARLALRLSFKTFSSLPLKELRMKVSEAVTKPLSSLRLFLSGEGKLTYALYELLFNDLLSVELRPQGAGGANQRTFLPKENVAPVGFTRDEGIFPDPQRRFRGYHILKEYFTFPEKFLFLDLVGLDPFTTTFEGDAFDVVFVFSKDFADERAVTRETFRLFSTPIVNLFRQQAEPVRITHRTADYRVIPDVRRQRALEVYSVESVTAARP